MNHIAIRRDIKNVIDIIPDKIDLLVLDGGEFSGLSEFNKFKLIKPKNIDEINNLADYVSLKIDSLSV